MSPKESRSFQGISLDGKRYNICFRVERIILIKPTGEIVLLCRLLADPFIHASPLLPIRTVLWVCHTHVVPPASAYEKSTLLHSNHPHTPHPPHPPHPFNSRHNYRISNIHSTPQSDIFFYFFLVFFHWRLFLFLGIIWNNGKVCTRSSGKNLWHQS